MKNNSSDTLKYKANVWLRGGFGRKRAGKSAAYTEVCEHFSREFSFKGARRQTFNNEACYYESGETHV